MKRQKPKTLTNSSTVQTLVRVLTQMNARECILMRVFFGILFAAGGLCLLACLLFPVGWAADTNSEVAQICGDESRPFQAGK